jgi:hypothetical protein
LRGLGEQQAADKLIEADLEWLLDATPATLTASQREIRQLGRELRQQEG